MGLHFKQTPTTGFTNPAAAAETAVFVTPVLAPTGSADAAQFNPVSISGTLNVTPGTTATQCNIRIRQGAGTGGPVLGPNPAINTVAAGAPQSISFGTTDATGYLQGGGQYTITVVMTGATGATSINMIDLEVLV